MSPEEAIPNAETQLQIHPVAESFPRMSDVEFDELVADIEENGLRDRVWLHPDGTIIDGRHRYWACLKLGLEPQFRTWNGKGSLERFVARINVAQRHLKESQRALVAARILASYKQEAKERQSTRKARGHKLPANLEEASRGEAAELAAKDLRVSRGSVLSAWTLLKRGAPELVSLVERTGFSVASAALLATEEPKAEQRELVLDGAKRMRTRAAEIRSEKRAKTAGVQPESELDHYWHSAMKVENAFRGFVAVYPRRKEYLKAVVRRLVELLDDDAFSRTPNIDVVTNGPEIN